MNHVALLGNLCNPPDIKYTPQGQAVTRLRLAANRKYTTSAGEKRDAVTYVDVVAWGKLAESCAEYLEKGSKVLVEGRLDSREWQNREGHTQRTIEVSAQFITFLSFKKKNGEPAPAMAR